MNGNQDNESKGFLKSKNIVFWSVLIGMFLIFLIVLSAMDNLKTSISNHPKSNPSSNQNNLTSSVSLELPVTITTEQRGKFLIITAKVRNTKNYPIDKKLMIYMEDSLGKKHFIDAIYVKLNTGEAGNVESSIKISDINGPEPYEIVTEWK